MASKMRVDGKAIRGEMKQYMEEAKQDALMIDASQAKCRAVVKKAKSEAAEETSNLTQSLTDGKLHLYTSRVAVPFRC